MPQTEQLVLRLMFIGFRVCDISGFPTQCQYEKVVSRYNLWKTKMDVEKHMEKSV